MGSKFQYASSRDGKGDDFGIMRERIIDDLDRESSGRRKEWNGMYVYLMGRMDNSDS